MAFKLILGFWKNGQSPTLPQYTETGEGDSETATPTPRVHVSVPCIVIPLLRVLKHQKVRILSNLNNLAVKGLNDEYTLLPCTQLDNKKRSKITISKFPTQFSNQQPLSVPQISTYLINLRYLIYSYYRPLHDNVRCSVNRCNV